MDHFPVVGIGASAGGLEAISELLAALPPATDMAYVLVQHLDPGHAGMLQGSLRLGPPRRPPRNPRSCSAAILAWPR